MAVSMTMISVAMVFLVVAMVFLVVAMRRCHGNDIFPRCVVTGLMLQFVVMETVRRRAEILGTSLDVQLIDHGGTDLHKHILSDAILLPYTVDVQHFPRCQTLERNSNEPDR